METIETLSNKIDRIFLLMEQQGQRPKAGTEKTENDFMTIDEVASFLNLKKATIYGKIHRKAIPVTRTGKRVLFSRKSILKWLDGNEVQPEQQEPSEQELSEQQEPVEQQPSVVYKTARKAANYV